MSTRRVALEVCLDSLDSAVAAARGGADRIELCSAMEVGGVTPSIGLVRAVQRAVRTPLHVLVRPRPGDFVYSDEELRLMLDDVSAAREAGADGIVTGALTSKGGVHLRATARLVRAAGPLGVTFHRAFDAARDRHGALEALIDLGVRRVLTSGGASNAFRGRLEIARLVAAAKGRIAMMAGGGVELRTVARLVAETGVAEVHTGSGVSTIRASAQGAFRARLGIVDARKVAAMRARLPHLPQLPQ